METNIRMVQVNTTAYEEENFFLLTDLTDEQIESIIRPIVEAERNGEDDDSFYDNDMLCEALREAYPLNVVICYSNTNSFDEITI